MKRHWETDELVEHWTQLPRETELLTNKTGATRLGFAVLLKFFQLEAYFPQQAHSDSVCGNNRCRFGQKRRSVCQSAFSSGRLSKPLSRRTVAI
jgi:hypothetical protein